MVLSIWSIGTLRPGRTIAGQTGTARAWQHRFLLFNELLNRAWRHRPGVADIDVLERTVATKRSNRPEGRTHPYGYLGQRVQIFWLKCGYFDRRYNGFLARHSPSDVFAGLLLLVGQGLVTLERRRLRSLRFGPAVRGHMHCHIIGQLFRVNTSHANPDLASFS